MGTTNLDYRSRLFNNEMGFFFINAPLADEMRQNTEYLKSYAYCWGSTDWLELRRKVRELKGLKGLSTRGQRAIYKTLEASGLEFLF